MSSEFEMEEFVNFTISDTEDQQQPLEPQDWTKYPDLFTKKEVEPSLITFDNASLMEEEYVDPFASLGKIVDSKQELLKKLKSRRQKLEMMAKSLTQIPNKMTRWELDMDCKGTNIHWQTQVQAYQVQIPRTLFNSEKQMATTMLHLFEMHLPEYLFV